MIYVLIAGLLVCLGIVVFLVVKLERLTERRKQIKAQENDV